MDNIEDVLQPGDVFSRIQMYELNREKSGRVFIFVHEILNGDSKGHFTAYPTSIVGGTKDEYLCVGNSHDEVLKECLSRLKGVVNMADVMHIA
jgi:hypothetical protein